MSNLLKIYQGLLTKYPYRVQSIQTAILMGTGDFLSQVAVEKKNANDYDLTRTAKFAGLGLLIGPCLRIWYGVLDRHIKHVGAKGVALKVAADQILFAPTFLVIFISSMGVLNGETRQLISNRLERDYKEILVTNWKVWPAVQTVNFYLVPLQHRVVVAQIVAIFWNTYLAFVSNQKPVENQEKVTE